MKLVRSVMYFFCACISLPIWFYLVYTMLSAIHPDRLVWFLFWIYMPVQMMRFLLAGVIAVYDKK